MVKGLVLPLSPSPLTVKPDQAYGGEMKLLVDACELIHDFLFIVLFGGLILLILVSGAAGSI